MKKNHLLIITSLFLFYAINNYFWLSQNQLPISYDEGIHLWTNLRFVRAFIYPAHHRLYELLHANTTHWPPLFYFTAFLFNIIFGTSYIVSVMTNMLFFALLIISLYLIGKEIHSSSVGILAVIIASLYPIIYGHSRLFLLDFALTAVVTFSIYCLIKTDRFRNLFWSVIFGISAGLGMLTKWSYLFFILPLFIYIAIISLRDIKKEKHLLMAILISFLIGSIWYVMNIERVGFALGHFKRGIGRHVYHPLEEIQWIVLTFNNNMLSFLFFLLFIICAAIFYIRINSKSKTFVTIWYSIPLLAISFVKWKQARFLMPILPCFALISAMSLGSIKNRKFKNVLVGFIFIIGLVQYFNISYNDKITKRMEIYNRHLKTINIFYRPELEGTYSIIGASPPHKTSWRHIDLVKSFVSHIQELDGYPFMAGIIYDEDACNIGLNNLFANRVMNYYLIRELIKSDVTLLGEISLALNQKDETKRFIEFIADMQGIVYISKKNMWPTLDDSDFFLNKKSQIVQSRRNKAIDNPQLFFRNKWQAILRLEDNTTKPWRLFFGNRLRIAKILRYRLMNDQRLFGLINSREKFSFIDRVKLPYGYYANVYLYNIPEIRKDNLAIKIFNGKVKMFYKEKELTKATGITFFFTYNNKTYTYADAIWDYHTISPYQIRVISEWPDPGIKQVILVSADLNKKNTVNISVTLESQKDIKLDHWHMDSLMSNVYKEWICPFSQGIFKEIPIFSVPCIYEQGNIRYAVPNIAGIKTHMNNSLPAVLFMCSDDIDTPVCSDLHNTGYYHNARCLRVAASSKIELKKGSPKKCLDMDIVLMSNSELERFVRKERFAYEK